MNDFDADTVSPDLDDQTDTSVEGSSSDRDDNGVDDRLELLLTAVFAMAAASVARKVTGGIWKATTGRTPPTNGKDGGADIAVIIMWGALAGATAGVARVLAERQGARLARARRSS